MCQLTDLVYDGGFEVLPWLQFPSVAPRSATEGAVRNGKKYCRTSAPLSALTAVKHGGYSSLTASARYTRKLLIWP